MKISVITAVYNAETTIANAIESVAGQTYQDVEHIIIDGGSTDGTLGLIEEMRNDRMVVVSEPDRGIYDAINKGIARASGDVIGLAHADDFLASQDVLTLIAASFSDPEIDACYGDLDYVSQSDPDKVIRHWRSSIFSKAKLKRGWMPPHPTLFMRRHVYETHGTYDITMRIAADYDAILRYFSRDDLRVHYIPQVLVKMRVGGASNGSLKRIIRKSKEDYQALRRNKVGGVSTLLFKNVSKIPQFFLR